MQLPNLLAAFPKTSSDEAVIVNKYPTTLRSEIDLSAGDVDPFPIGER